jgi:hypothetical protein
MKEKTFNYTTTINQPQMVGKKRLDPGKGIITESELKALKKDAYGISLLNTGLLIIDTEPVSAPETTPEPEQKSESAPVSTGSASGSSDEIPDFGNAGYEEKNPNPQEHAGWKPE